MGISAAVGHNHASMTEETERGQTIFLTGPTLSGKTTTAQQWAMQRARATFSADWDEIRATVRDADQLRGSLVPDDIAQYRFAARVAAAMAARITAAGIDCVIAGTRVPEGHGDPPEWRHMWDDVDLLDPIILVLLPSVEARLARARADPRRRGPYLIPEEHIRDSAGWAWDAWRAHPRAAVLDTSTMSQEQVIAELEHAVAALSPAAQR